MHEARFVHRLEGLGGLANETQAVAVEHGIAADDQRVEIRTIDELQGDVLTAVGRGAMFQRFDQAGVLQQHSHFALGRLLQSPEAFLEGGRLFTIENFEAHDPAGAKVFGLIELRHGAGNTLPQQGIALGNIDAGICDLGLE